MALLDKPLNDKTIALDDASKTEDSFNGGGLLSFIRERYTKADEGRRNDETRWLRAYRNYRGLYGPDVKFTETEKSRVFIKVTKTKTLAAYGQIADVLFSNNKFPLSIDPSVLPEGVAESVHFDPKAPPDKGGKKPSIPFGEEGAASIGADFDLDKLEEMLGSLAADLKDIPGIKNGPGVTPSSATFLSLIHI